ICNSSSEFFDQGSGVRKRLLSFCIPPLGLVEVAEGDTYAPVHRSRPLCPGNLLRRLEDNFGLDRPLQHDQRFATQFQDTQAALSLSSLWSGCDQPIEDI